MSKESTQPTGPSDETDWKRLRSMSDAEAEANALSDPDNPPLTEERLASMRRVPQVRVMRRALRLSQDEFAARYGIPLDTLRDWEESRTVPDATASAYLRVIAQEPEVTARAYRGIRAA